MVCDVRIGGLRRRKRVGDGDGVFEVDGLLEALRQRLVAHHGVVALAKFGAVLPKPLLDAALAAYDRAVWVADEAVVDVGLQILQHRPEDQHFAWVAANAPELCQKRLRRGDGVERGSPAGAEPFMREGLAPRLLPLVVPWAANLTQGDGDETRHEPQRRDGADWRERDHAGGEVKGIPDELVVQVAVRFELILDEGADSLSNRTQNAEVQGHAGQIVHWHQLVKCAFGHLSLPHEGLLQILAIHHDGGGRGSSPTPRKTVYHGERGNATTVRTKITLR